MSHLMVAEIGWKFCTKMWGFANPVTSNDIQIHISSVLSEVQYLRYEQSHSQFTGGEKHGNEIV